MLKSLVVAALCVPAYAQVKHISVHTLQQTDSQVTYRVVNESRQPLTSYTVGVDLTYPDGAVIRAEVSGEFGPSGHAIAPGATLEQAYPLGGSMHGKASNVEFVPLVAIYGDGSAEAKDSAVFHRIADHRVTVEKAKEILVDAAQQALSEQGKEHPSAKAPELVRAAIKRSDAETALPGHKVIVIGKTPIQPDEGLLEDGARFFEGLGGIPDERGKLTSYLATERRELDEWRPFANVHLGGVQ